MTAVAPPPTDMDKTSDGRTLTEANAYKRLYPVEYLRRFVSENVRPDGREKDQWRDMRINVGMSCAIGERVLY
jgi:exosome complex component RRP43